MRFIRALVFVRHGVAPAGTGSTPKRPLIGLAVADGVAVGADGVAVPRAAIPAELVEAVTR
jgi:hypothetical protein